MNTAYTPCFVFRCADDRACTTSAISNNTVNAALNIHGHMVVMMKIKYPMPDFEKVSCAFSGPRSAYGTVKNTAPSTRAVHPDAKICRKVRGAFSCQRSDAAMMVTPGTMSATKKLALTQYDATPFCTTPLFTRKRRRNQSADNTHDAKTARSM